MLQYPWTPYKTIHLGYDDRAVLHISGFSSLDDLDEFATMSAHYQIDTRLYAQINDIIHLSVQNALQHTTSQETLALARDRIPSGAHDDNTLRFLIAFLYEKQLEFNDLKEYVKGTLRYNRHWKKYMLGPSPDKISEFINRWTENANKIVEILNTARSKVGALAQDSDFIRDWALINLGKKTGLEVTANGNPFSIGVVQNSVTQYFSLLAGQSVMMERLKGLKVVALRSRVANPDDMTIVAKNGPSEVRIKTDADTWGAPFVLAKDASRTVTKAEMAHDIESTPI